MNWILVYCCLLLQVREQISWTKCSLSTLKTIILVVCLPPSAPSLPPPLPPYAPMFACMCPLLIIFEAEALLLILLLYCTQKFPAVLPSAFSLTVGMLGIRLHTLATESSSLK